MKKLILLLVFTAYVFAKSFYSIGHSQLIDGNILTFESPSKDFKVDITVKNKNILINGINELKRDYKNAQKLKDFVGLSNILSVSDIIQKITNHELSTEKKYLIYSGGLLLKCGLKSNKEEQDTLFSDFKQISHTIVTVDNSLNLKTLKYNKKHYELLSVFYDKEKNLHGFIYKGNEYKLKKVSNRALEDFIDYQKNFINNFDKSDEKVTAYYTKKDGYKLKKMSISYEFMKEKKNTPLLVTLIQDKNNKKIQSTAELYDLKKYNVLFQFKGSAKNKNIPLFKFTQSPNTEDVFVESSIGEESVYSRQGVYFYNQAGLLYLLSWMKKNDIEEQSAFVFSGSTDALVTKIESSGYNFDIIYKSGSQKMEIDKNGFLQKIGDYIFDSIETPFLKELKERENIIRVFNE